MSANPRLVLHIGMHKTGSTSLQWFFVLNRLLLRLWGIDYPKSYDADGRRLVTHNDLFHAISHEKDFNRPHPVLGPSAARVNAAAARLRPGRILLLSAEGFSGESPAFARAFAPLRERADVRVVCFLRRQDDWVQSFYKQMVRGRATRENRDFRQFLTMDSTRMHLDYLQLLGWWADAFGDQAIRVVIYPPRAGVVPSFIESAGLPPALRRLPFSRVTLNRSLPSGYIERIRAANLANLPPPEPDPNESDESFFSPEERRRFMAAYTADNEVIRRRFRPDLARLFD